MQIYRLPQALALLQALASTKLLSLVLDIPVSLLSIVQNTREKITSLW